MVLTRATAKRLEAEKAANSAAAVETQLPVSSNATNPLTRTSTLVLVTRTPNGLGTHTRWIRGEEAARQRKLLDAAMKVDDVMDEDVAEQNAGDRLVTPAPSSPTTQQAPWAPRKCADREQGRVGGLEAEDTFQYVQKAVVGPTRSVARRNRKGLFEREDKKVWEHGPDTLPINHASAKSPATPRQNGAFKASPRKLKREDCMMEDDILQPRMKRQALGPCGTLLVDAFNNPIYEDVPRGSKMMGPPNVPVSPPTIRHFNLASHMPAQISDAARAQMAQSQEQRRQLPPPASGCRVVEHDAVPAKHVRF